MKDVFVLESLQVIGDMTFGENLNVTIHVVEGSWADLNRDAWDYGYNIVTE